MALPMCKEVPTGWEHGIHLTLSNDNLITSDVKDKQSWMLVKVAGTDLKLVTYSCNREKRPV